MFRLLIADRQRDLLWGLENYLQLERSDKVEIDTTTSGETAIEKFNKQPYDLVITELKLEGKEDGFDLIHHARKVNTNVKIILNSSLDEMSTKRLGRRLAVDFLFQKPFSLKQLSEAIDYVSKQPTVWAAKKIERASFVDLLKMLCKNERTALITVTYQGFEGLVAIDQGEIVDAAYRGQSGEVALQEICALNGGSVQLHSGVTVDRRTIHRSWVDLVVTTFSHDRASFQKVSEANYFDEKLIADVMARTDEVYRENRQIKENSVEFLLRNQAVLAYGLLKDGEIFSISFGNQPHNQEDQKHMISYLDHVVSVSRRIHEQFNENVIYDFVIELDTFSLVIERILETRFAQFALVTRRTDIDFVRLLMKQMSASYSLALAGYHV